MVFAAVFFLKYDKNTAVFYEEDRGAIEEKREEFWLY